MKCSHWIVESENFSVHQGPTRPDTRAYTRVLAVGGFTGAGIGRSRLTCRRKVCLACTRDVILTHAFDQTSQRLGAERALHAEIGAVPVVDMLCQMLEHPRDVLVMKHANDGMGDR